MGSRCPGCAPRRRRKRKKVAAARRRKDWEQDSIYDGIGVPDDEFNYEEFLDREFGKKPHQQLGIKWYWWVSGAVLVGAMVWTAFFVW